MHKTLNMQIMRHFYDKILHRTVITIFSVLYLFGYSIFIFFHLQNSEESRG